LEKRQNLNGQIVDFAWQYLNLFLFSFRVFVLLFLFSWWKITTHLGWSLLELSEGLELFNSVDSISEHLARVLFAAYLVVALILLINMLIALLSNTYQQVQVSDLMVNYYPCSKVQWSLFFFFCIIIYFFDQKALKTNCQV